MKGDPLVVTGTVYATDGKPVPGIRMFVYHTDAEGYYNRPDNDPRRAEINGWLETDSRGRYELRTIKPASYPNTTIESHIHVHLAGAGAPEHTVDNFLFAGDSYLSKDALERSERLGKFANVMQVRRTAGGVLECSRDIRFDPAVAQARPVRR